MNQLINSQLILSALLQRLPVYTGKIHSFLVMHPFIFDGIIYWELIAAIYFIAKYLTKFSQKKKA